jgi:hypothetical protein
MGEYMGRVEVFARTLFLVHRIPMVFQYLAQTRFSIPGFWVGWGKVVGYPKGKTNTGESRFHGLFKTTRSWAILLGWRWLVELK